MLAQGTPLWVVSEVLGHASIAITKDTYGHLLSAEKREATEAITATDRLPDSPLYHFVLIDRQYVCQHRRYVERGVLG
jgi:hypothetical protein